MPKNQDTLNNNLFSFLQSRGYDPVLYDSSGKEMPVPEEAEVFQFNFVKDDVDYGKVTVTIDGLRQLIVYYGKDVENSPKNGDQDSESWHQLLKKLSMFAHNNQLSFDTRYMDRLKYDMAKRDHARKLDEGYYPMGKTKSYSDNIPECKIIIQHSRPIEEGEQRYRNVAKIFIENAQGERFLSPTNKPGLARVYARHIAEGGTPYDERGQHITSLVEEYSKMAGFVRATRGNQFNESTQKLVNEGIGHYQKLRESLHKLAGKKGYNTYFESWTPSLMEDEVTEDLSDMFKSSSLDPRIESVMPILSKLKKNVTEEVKMNEVAELEEWASSVIESELANEDIEDLDEDWKSALAGGALAASMALGGAGAAQAQQVPDAPAATQQADAPVPLSKRFTPGVEFPGAYMISYQGKEYQFAGRAEPAPKGGEVLTVPAGAVGIRGLAPVKVTITKDGKYYAGTAETNEATQPEPEEADYGDDYQDMVKRAGEAVKRIDKKLGKPDIEKLAKRINQPEKVQESDELQQILRLIK